MSLLQGPVVFIDDELNDESKPAYSLKKQIKESGRPLAEYLELPPEEHALQWRSIAFLLLDWDLVPGSPGGIGASTLSNFARESLFAWLEGFVDQVFCPVFVVSAEDVADIERQVAGNAKLLELVQSGRLKVFSKQALMPDFIGYLEQWVASSPALAALNIWVNEYERATDRLFQDMEKLQSDWPSYIWRVAEDEGVDPSYELASVISANLLHRIDVLKFDVAAISQLEENPAGAALRRVVHGRTTVPRNRLYETTVLPGDLFEGEDEGEIWINVTPACHTVLNRKLPGHDKPDPDNVVLHLVKGQRLSVPSSKSKFNTQKKDHDGPNGMIVHAMFGEEPYAFSFRNQTIRTWGEIGQSRVGRLLPPFVTLLQQRNAAFLMNEGLPPVTFDLYGDLTGS